MIEKLEKLSKIVNTGLMSFANVCLFFMTIIVMVQIVTRYFFQYSIPWAEEISKLFMVWVALLCSAVLVYEDKHVAITFIYDRFSIRVRLLLKLFFLVLITGFSLVLVYTGIIYTAMNFSVIMPASGITRFWLYVPIPLMAACIVIHCIVLIVRTVHQLQGKIPYVQKTWEEELH